MNGIEDHLALAVALSLLLGILFYALYRGALQPLMAEFKLCVNERCGRNTLALKIRQDYPKVTRFQAEMIAVNAWHEFKLFNPGFRRIASEIHFGYMASIILLFTAFIPYEIWTGAEFHPWSWLCSSWPWLVTSLALGIASLVREMTLDYMLHLHCALIGWRVDEYVRVAIERVGLNEA